MFSKKQSQDIDFQKGETLLINKSINWTSFDVVKKIRTLLKIKYGYEKIKVGHAGTLDPLATGLIIICTGRATKEISEYQSLHKEYIAAIKFGATTPSYDLETGVDKQYEISHITEDSFKQAIKTFIGKIDQVPPSYSAKKIQGERAYDKVRRGEKVELMPVKIEIKKIETLEFNLPVVKLHIVCSKGSYIRALARDFGFALKSGAHLIALERTCIGKFKLKNALSIEEFEKILIKT